MKQPIHTHTFDNGLVLVAEPIPSLESAAFSFLVPAGCAYEAPADAGLALLTCEMTLRGAGSRDCSRRPLVEERIRTGLSANAAPRI